MTAPTDALIERYGRWLQNIGYDGGPDSPPMRMLDAYKSSLARIEAAEKVNAKLVADLARFDAEIVCEGCQAPLFEGDDFVSDPGDCYGCWAAMTDLPSKRERPCYAYRVGKPSAGDTVDPDALTGCADDQTFADCEPDALRAAAQWQAGQEGEGWARA